MTGKKKTKMSYGKAYSKLNDTRNLFVDIIKHVSKKMHAYCILQETQKKKPLQKLKPIDMTMKNSFSVREKKIDIKSLVYLQ